MDTPEMVYNHTCDEGRILRHFRLLFFDCQKCKKKNIKYKYLRYSIIKTIEKTDLYINKKMKDLYNNLKEQNLNNKNGKKSEDFILIEKTLHEVEEKNDPGTCADYR